MGPTANTSWSKYDMTSGHFIGYSRTHARTNASVGTPGHTRPRASMLRYTQLVIHGATPLDVIAYLMDLNGRHFRSRINPQVDIRCEKCE